MTLKRNFKEVVNTIKAINESIVVAEADNKVDRSDTIETLKQNRTRMFLWGQELQKRILEKEANSMKIIYS